MARSAFSFGRDRPASRNIASLAASTPSAVSGSTSFSNRPKIARALAVDTCCDTMIEARLAKPGARAPQRHLSGQRANGCKPRIDPAKRVESGRNIVKRRDPPL